MHIDRKEKVMSIFGKLFSVFSRKKQGVIETPKVPNNKEQPVVSEEKKNEPVKYGVIVEMEHPGVLADKEKVKEAIRDKLRGGLYFAACFSESGPETNSLAPCVRRFALDDQSDFQSFVQAMKTIDGVIGVKKGDGPWTKTKAEQQAEDKERKRIAKEKEKRAEEGWKERERKLAEFKKLKEETKRSDEETYGPSSAFSRLSQKELEEFLTPIVHCEAEVRGVFSDMMAGGFINYEREVAKLSGNDVVSFFEKSMNGKLRMPFQKKSPFYDIPFSVEYRQNNGRKFAHLTVGGGKPTFIMAGYDLFVRE